jgi:hypothetical protein
MADEVGLSQVTLAALAQRLGVRQPSRIFASFSTSAAKAALTIW